ncbi:MAG: ABC transporter permease subunit [Rhizobiaceae bacterium]
MQYHLQSATPLFTPAGFIQAVPVFALAPILTLWLGYGIGGNIAMIVLIIYFPITSSFYDGLKRVDSNLLDLAQTMGATKTQIMRRIRIPSALPSLGSGLRLAAVYAPIGAVIGEWVGVLAELAPPKPIILHYLARWQRHP